MCLSEEVDEHPALGRLSFEERVIETKTRPAISNWWRLVIFSFRSDLIHIDRVDCLGMDKWVMLLPLLITHHRAILVFPLCSIW